MAHYSINTNGQIAITDLDRQGHHAHFENVTIENQSTTTDYAVQFFTDRNAPGARVEVKAGKTEKIRIGHEFPGCTAGTLRVEENGSSAEFFPGAVAVGVAVTVPPVAGVCYPNAEDVGNDAYAGESDIYVCTFVATTIYAVDRDGRGIPVEESVLEGWDNASGIAELELTAGGVGPLRAKKGVEGESYFTTERPNEVTVDVVKGYIKVVKGA